MQFRKVKRRATLIPYCENPSYVRAWMGHWHPIQHLFPAKYCQACGELTSDMDPVREFVFEWLFLPFWDGSVVIDYGTRL
jgi:hypothetical protein